MPQQLGDRPIEERYIEQMRAIAKTLDEFLNGDLKGADRPTGFILMVFPFNGVSEGRCNYISNGADRKDVVTMMKEQIKRFEGQPEIVSRA